MSDKKSMADKCAVTRDLMPLCIDGTASEASQRRVSKHVEACETCAVIYQEMQTQIDLDVPVEQETEQFDTAVKKVRHKHAWRRLRNVLLGVVLALAVCAGLAYGYYWYFVEEVPVPVDSYKLELVLRANTQGKIPVIIKTENLPKSAKLNIEVRADGMVMNSAQQTRPNLVMYIWAATTRSADLVVRRPACNFYGFDQLAAGEKDLWSINGEKYRVETIYQGAPEAEHTLLYKTSFNSGLKWSASDEVLHGVSSIVVWDEFKESVPAVTQVPQPMNTPMAPQELPEGAQPVSAPEEPLPTTTPMATKTATEIPVTSTPWVAETPPAATEDPAGIIVVQQTATPEPTTPAGPIVG